MKKHYLTWLFLICTGLLACGKSPVPRLTVFYAPCFSPLLNSLHADIENKIGVKLASEMGGSQVLCRKLSDLGRECDLLLVADAELLKKLLAQQVDWRLDMAHDEMVLGIGIRARRIDEAEKNWIPVLQDPQIVLGRVNENLSPVGYRTLLVWKLQEQAGYPGLTQTLVAKTSKIMEHVEQLAALLKNGDVEYGFIYRTTCLEHDIRFISLAPEINLGKEGYPYSRAQITYAAKSGSNSQPQTVVGGLITYAVTIPRVASQPAKAKALLHYLLVEKADFFKAEGFNLMTPLFYGSHKAYSDFKSWAEYGGEF